MTYSALLFQPAFASLSRHQLAARVFVAIDLVVVEQLRVGVVLLSIMELLLVNQVRSVGLLVLMHIPRKFSKNYYIKQSLLHFSIRRERGEYSANP